VNLVDAITLYCHIMQRAGGGINGRATAKETLINHNVMSDVIASIEYCVSNDGHIVSGNGGVFALTQISTS
jgi:hypothetical protein